MNTVRLPWSAEIGFTFIEMLVTLALLALLASVVLPVSDLMSRQEKERELKRALIDIRHGLDEFKHASEAGKIPDSLKSPNGYPLQLNTLLEVPSSSSKEAPQRFLRRIPRDPFFPDAAEKPEDTWGKRAYQSASVNSSTSTSDIYDVYSQSTQTGLNGIPYKDW